MILTLLLHADEGLQLVCWQEQQLGVCGRWEQRLVGKRLLQQGPGQRVGA
jgi:hypothetical protein